MLVFKSLRQKLLISMLGIGLLPLMLAGFISCYVSYQGLTQQAIKQVENLPKQAGEWIESLLYYRYVDIQNFAALPMARNQNWNQLHTFYNEVLNFYESYAWLGMLDADGVIRAASNADHEGLAQAGETWFQRVINEKSIVIEDVHSSTLSSEPVITFSTPIYNYEGKLTGVVHSEIKAAIVLSYVQAIETSAHGLALVLNQQGIPLGSQMSLSDAALSALPSLKSLHLKIGEEPGVTRENFAGRDRLISYLPLKGHGPYPGLGWTLVVMKDTQEVFASAKDQVRLVLLSVLITAMIVSFVALILAKSITQPLKRLAGQAREIAGGNHFLSWSPQSSDEEISQLQTALKVMLTTQLDKQDLLEKSNSDLKINQQELERVNRELARNMQATNQFLGTISHELKTPLSAIVAFVEMVCLEEVGTLNARQKEYLQDALDGSKDLQQLIEDLLDLYRLESANLRLRMEPLELWQVFAAVKVMMEPLAHKNNIQLRFITTENLPFLVADRRRIKQILINLVSNAIKFTPAFGEVKVKAVVGDETPPRLIIKVIDNGIGISEESLPKVFEKFYQADATATRMHGGAGLGLALTKQLVVLHHGAIWVESIPDQGSVFYVALPLEREEAAAKQEGGGSGVDAGKNIGGG
ncbi:MAG: sensor histidine kinase [Thermincola sp.]|jgi:signal transduction histidine kinase|nr:sensor histidine kinase [Thermincola sp.]MDT3703775.1 sensor histidine kinase [Thermincola sp.]